MRRLILVAAMCGLLSACATPPGPDRVSVQTVYVPTPVPCASRAPPAPIYPDTDAAIRAAPNIYERAKLYAIGRQLRIARLSVVEAANSGCSK